MARVIVTFKIMPDSPDVDMDALRDKVIETIKLSVGETETKVEIEPVAFGLKSLKIMYVADESKGSPDLLEKEIGDIEGVNSVEISDVRRAIG